MIRFLVLFVLLAVPCRAEPTSTEPVPAGDAARAGLRIGLLHSHPAMAEPMQLAAIERGFSTALDLPVTVIAFATLGALVDAHASGRIDYAPHTALSFAATRAVCACVEALRRPVGAEGIVGFRSVLVRASPPAQTTEILRVAYSTRRSLSGWLLPAAADRAGALPELMTFEVGSVRAVAERFADGTVNGFFAWVPVGANEENVPLPERLFAGRYAGLLYQRGDMEIVWQSAPVYHGPHALHRDIPTDLAQRLGAFLDAMPQNAPGLLDIIEPIVAGGYAPATTEDYRSVMALVDPAGSEAAGLAESDTGEVTYPAGQEASNGNPDR
ncbi:phosphate/phosphite/phosphonate ABC transporter substrate-binding protein [Pseudohoeflea coraliihabitans]|uniref:PhnD/SsuA/transferrin family substrate-binding protein n=1 Tax=Pseudohoeflea coraliihabitans TaxID=2860393 RepID=A0ABS6WP99_9HYPH|nr:PhnD/SsuA/transferrin family substrate-binding protein [Pseudohoeflea sp. DP4N28-3]MBW3097791.1 PhnD/SsuA/transferrin family substrate-binding protein [Pseudohoeflea sp. DP4N28-3]